MTVNNMGNYGEMLSNTGIRVPSITNAGCRIPTSCLSSAAPGKVILLASNDRKGFTAVTAVETVIEIQATTCHFKEAPWAQCS